ncbi:c-type cytochrome [Candidatus Rhodobacter oscarellae]|nr:cytochrome c family protein [Candidatus Rhodobacter lobularis]
MTATKIVGAICGTFLVFLLGNFAGELIYHVGASDHGDGHGDGHGKVVQAYTIDTGVTDDHGGDDEPEIPFSEIYAAADPAKGEGEFKACKSCHKVEDGANGTGPHLYGLVGRAVGGVDGFGYSGNLVKVAQTWGVEELNLFLENPKGYAPGTKMSYRGMKDPEDRANLIAWLDSLDD